VNEITTLASVFLEHISEALRAFFHVLDNIVSLFSSKTMAETYNPVARSLVGRNHFLTKPNRETDLSRAMQNFEEKLSQLNAAKEKPGPSP